MRRRMHYLLTLEKKLTITIYKHNAIIIQGERDFITGHLLISPIPVMRII